MLLTLIAGFFGGEGRWAVGFMVDVEFNTMLSNIHILYFNHKNYNFLACDWFKNVLFSTNSLAKLLSDMYSLLLDSLLLDSLLSDNHMQRCSLNQPITFKVVITCAGARAVTFVFLP